MPRSNRISAPAQAMAAELEAYIIAVKLSAAPIEEPDVHAVYEGVN
ncbi:hypothetical protein [Sphingomonas sp. NFX23]